MLVIHNAQKTIPGMSAHAYQERICILEVHGSEACGGPQYVLPEPSKCMSPHGVDVLLAHTSDPY